MSVDKSIQQAGEAIAKAIIEYQKLLESQRAAAEAKMKEKLTADNALEAQKASEVRMADLFKEKMSEALKENNLSPEEAEELNEAVAETLKENGINLKKEESEANEVSMENEVSMDSESVAQSIDGQNWEPGTIGEALQNEKIAAGMHRELGNAVEVAQKIPAL